MKDDGLAQPCSSMKVATFITNVTNTEKRNFSFSLMYTQFPCLFTPSFPFTKTCCHVRCIIKTSTLMLLFDQIPFKSHIFCYNTDTTILSESQRLIFMARFSWLSAILELIEGRKLKYSWYVIYSWHVFEESLRRCACVNVCVLVCLSMEVSPQPMGPIRLPLWIRS